MKKTLNAIVTGTVLALAIPHALASEKPFHGGVVSETKAFDVELVVKPTVLHLHLRDHDGKPIAVAQASAKVTLLSGTEKQEVELKPAGDKLEATGSFKLGPGTKAVVVVTVAGKPTTARFTLK